MPTYEGQTLYCSSQGYHHTDNAIEAHRGRRNLSYEFGIQRAVRITKRAFFLKLIVLHLLEEALLAIRA
jgi:hypothetical protein